MVQVKKPYPTTCCLQQCILNTNGLKVKARKIDVMVTLMKKKTKYISKKRLIGHKKKKFHHYKRVNSSKGHNSTTFFYT